MTDWGVHLLDFALHGMNAEMPETVSPGGGIYYNPPGAIETPDIQQAIYGYPTHTMIWEAGLNPGIGPYQKGHGVAFVGEKGTLVVTRNGYELLPDYSSELKGPFFEARTQADYGDGLNEHVENFLAAVRKGEPLNAPVEIGAKTAIISEMGNIAYRVGERIHWDDAAKSFKEDAANALIKLKYNPEWQLPKV